MLLQHERDYGLGMHVLVTVCSWNTNGIMVWAWMLWSQYDLATRTLAWFEHGCSGHGMLLEHDVIMVWAWMLCSPYALGTCMRVFAETKHADMHIVPNAAWASDFWCCARTYGLGMDALVTACPWNTDVIMLWAWMLWSTYAFGTRAGL